MSTDKNNCLLESQYKRAIEARHTLNDNFHKWMTYYYVANGAILVAITALYGKGNWQRGILALSLLGIFVCILWNLSCKGYYYWSKNYINIIIKLERKIIGEDLSLGIYSVFTRKVAEEEDSSWIPIKPANISTPKLTLLFSLVSLCSWTILSIWLIFDQYDSLATYKKIILSSLLILLIVLTYTLILPRFSKSRLEEFNTLV